MSTATDVRPTSRSSAMGVFLRTAGPSLLFDVALPYLVYLVLTGQGMSEVSALALSALPPVLSVAWTALRTRRLNGVGAIVLASIAIGIGMSLLSGDPRFAVARDALPNLVLAIALGGSLLTGGRPLMFFVIRTFGETDRAGLRERMAHLWSVSPEFRSVMRRSTMLAAGLMLAEVAIRLVAATTLPVGVALPLLQIQSFVVWTGLVLLLRRDMVRAGRAADAAASLAPVA